MNDHWNVLYQVTVFYTDRKSKMATTVGHRLTLNNIPAKFGSNWPSGFGEEA
jgi:hypothetical protein